MVFNVQFFPIQCYCLPPTSKYSLKYPVLKHSQSILPSMWETKFAAQDKIKDKLWLVTKYQPTLCNIPKVQRYCSVMFDRMFSDSKGEKIEDVNWRVTSISWFWSAPNFFKNAIYVWYSCSKCHVHWWCSFRTPI